MTPGDLPLPVLLGGEPEGVWESDGHKKKVMRWGGKKKKKKSTP